MFWSPFLTGLTLAIVSCLFIGLSFVIKKVGLIRLSGKGIRAGRGGYGYLRDWVWWLGFLFMALGEMMNFTAYAFAPASLVTPLGALSVLVSTILAHKYLKENLNVFSKLGCLLCIIGSTVIVIHAPKETEVTTLDEISWRLTKSLFIVYFVTVIIVTMVLINFYVPRYGSSNVLVYVSICSLIGSLSVISCKGIGLGLRQTFDGDSQLVNPLFWVLLVAVCVSITMQMNYLNKALDIFDTSIVTPVYYVLFTSFVLIASSILFEEWNLMTPTDIVGDFCGFATVIVGIFMMNAFKDLRVDLSTLRNHIVKNVNNGINENRYLSQVAIENPGFYNGNSLKTNSNNNNNNNDNNNTKNIKAIHWTHHDDL